MVVLEAVAEVEETPGGLLADFGVLRVEDVEDELLYVAEACAV